MSDTKQLPKRHEVEEAKTWDLTTIYESDTRNNACDSMLISCVF